MTGEVVRDDTYWHDLPDVVLSRTSAQEARLFAAQWTAGGVSRMGHRHIRVDDWTLFRLDEPWDGELRAAVHDLPVVRLLGGSSGTRRIEVTTGTADVVLLPGNDLPASALPASALPASAPPASALRGSALFPELDDARLAAALRSPLDARWSVGVLAALGVPTVAADVHEGREAPESWGSITRVPAAPVAVAEWGPRRRTQRGVVVPAVTVVLALLLAVATVAVVVWMLR